MSFYALIGAVALEIVGVILLVTSALILRVQSTKQTNKSDKNSLLAASIMMGISILFVILTLVAVFKNFAAGKCKSKRTGLIIYGSLALICLIIAVVIALVFRNKAKKNGDAAAVQALKSAGYYLPLVALILMSVGLLIFILIIGRKIRRFSKVCKKVQRVKSRVPTSK
jgi:uncharacterized membrane protein